MTDEKNPYRNSPKDGKEGLTWFRLMWKNAYLQLFVVAIVFLVVELSFRDEFYSELGFYVGISIPIGMMIMISTMGFYKFWKEYSKTLKK